MKRNGYINIQIVVNSLLLLLLFLCARSRASASTDLLPRECNEYTLVSGDLKMGSMVYVDTSEDYPWHQDAACVKELLSKSQRGSKSGAVVAYNLVAKQEKFNERGMDQFREVSFIRYLCSMLGACGFSERRGADEGLSDIFIFTGRSAAAIPRPDINDKNYKGVQVIVGNDPKLFSSCGDNAQSKGNFNKEVVCIKKNIKLEFPMYFELDTATLY